MICQMYNIFKFIREVKVDERKVSERKDRLNEQFETDKSLELNQRIE